MPFVSFSELPARALFPGATAHYAHTDRLTLGAVDLATGAVVPPHAHPHDQISLVISGRAEFTVGDEVRLLGPGDCAVIPGGATHQARAVTACRIVDTFAPARDDYR